MVLTAVDDDHEEHCRPGDCGVSTLHDGERAAALRAASDRTIASSQRALIVAALCSNWNAVSCLRQLVFYFEKWAVLLDHGINRHDCPYTTGDVWSHRHHIRCGLNQGHWGFRPDAFTRINDLAWSDISTPCYV